MAFICVKRRFHANYMNGYSYGLLNKKTHMVGLVTTGGTAAPRCAKLAYLCLLAPSLPCCVKLAYQHLTAPQHQNLAAKYESHQAPCPETWLKRGIFSLIVMAIVSVS